MLRLLFFVEPKPLPANLFRNHYWADFPIRLSKQLSKDGQGVVECHAAVPARFSNLINSSGVFGDNVYIFDESKIFQELSRSEVSLREHWVTEFLGTTDDELKTRIDDIVCSSLPDGPWDVVFSFGEECRYSFAKSSFRVNMETSPFSRPPFKHSFFMDHLGLFRNSAPSTFFGNDAPKDSHLVPCSDLAETIRNEAWNNDPKESMLGFKKRFDRYFLLPLQASNYPSFDAQCRYQTQTDFLMDSLNQFGADTGVIVTEHPEVPSISRSYDTKSLMSGLEDIYPNLIFLPRAKHFPSASFDLLSEVDGVWTIASNIAPVAGLNQTLVGTPESSHLHYISDANSISELTSLQKPSRHKHEPALEWIFRNYLIPTHKVEEPGWLLDYVLDRRAAYFDHGKSPSSFLENDFQPTDFLEEKENVGTTRNIHYKSLIEHKIENYRTKTRVHLQNLGAKKSGTKSYILLNDTAELETYRHIGCNHVQSTIFQNMSNRGFHLVGRYNGKSDFPENITPPDWIIINGEGSFHHQSYRAIEMMEIALEYQKKGTRIALINSIWEANDSQMADLVRPFDVIAVRDSQSKRELEKEGISPILTSDFSIDNWQPLPQEYRRPRNGLFVSDNIVFERAVNLFDASQRFNGTYWLLDHRQVDRFEKAGCFAESSNWSLSPDFLTADWPIEAAENVLTGRFHVAMACIAFETPFLFVESNTMKITNLCKDIGLPVQWLNVTDVVESCDWRELEKRFSKLAYEFPDYLPQIKRFKMESSQQIESVFDSISREQENEPTQEAA